MPKCPKCGTQFKTLPDEPPDKCPSCGDSPTDVMKQIEEAGERAYIERGKGLVIKMKRR